MVGVTLLAACGPGTGDGAEPTDSIDPSSDARITKEVPVGPLDSETESAITSLLTSVYTQEWDVDAISELAAQGDIRTAWLLADLMRFHQSGEPSDLLVEAFRDLTGATGSFDRVAFVWAMNELMAADVPAWDGYRDAKAQVYLPIEANWEPFFTEPGEVDWRLVTWGGVRADARPLGDNGPCTCIPALDHPPTTSAEDGDWYGDDRVVFGIVVGDEALALPKHQMEVHEMVNLTLGGRELGVPYCTLCASAQAYYLDEVDGHERLVLRTSGLLSRSNKLMYDLVTGSAIDTFTGRALTGELYEMGITLQQETVVAATWGDWKSAHPDTRILAQDGGIDRVYSDDPLRGRDDDGPIFPVGEVDPRLPVQAEVIGVVTSEGVPVAFPVEAVSSALASGPVEFEGLTVRLEDGIRVYEGASEVVSHQSFWFAWSQFNEGTLLWESP